MFNFLDRYCIMSYRLQFYLTVETFGIKNYRLAWFNSHISESVHRVVLIITNIKYTRTTYYITTSLFWLLQPSSSANGHLILVFRNLPYNIHERFKFTPCSSSQTRVFTNNAVKLIQPQRWPTTSTANGSTSINKLRNACEGTMLTIRLICGNCVSYHYHMVVY